MKIGITNVKGGVGKTTLAINIAVCLVHMGYRVCIVDTDINQNSLSWYAARDTRLPRVIVAGSTETKALNKMVDALNDEYEIVIIDGTPSLSEMNSRIMMASDLLIIPTRPAAHDYRAMEHFMERLSQVRELKEVAAYFMVNEYDDRIKMHRIVRDSLDTFNIPVLTSFFKTRTAYGEAALQGIGAYEHADGKAREEVAALTNEIIDQAEKLHYVKRT